MTSQFSKYGRQRDDTVSQTGKRQFSRASEQDQTGDYTAGMSFDLNAQHIIPLMQKLKQQNQRLKCERDQVQRQMSQLKSVSQGILEENAQMRLHYQHRTYDIKKVIATMSINMQQQIQDISHMTHMYKNHNYSIVKSIETAKKQVNQRNEEVDKIQHQLAVLAERNSLLNEEIITRNVKIRQMKQKMDELRQVKSKQDNVFRLQDEVDRLMEEVTQLRNTNMKKLKNTQFTQTNNQIQKPRFTAQNVNVIQTIKNLKQQLSQMKEQQKAFNHNIQNLSTYHNKITQKCQKSNRERQRQTLQIQSQQMMIKQSKQVILTHQSKQKQLQHKKAQFQEQKYQLQKQLSKRRQKMQRQKSQQYMQKQNVQKEFKQKSSKQRTQHNVEVEKKYDQLTFRLNPEKEKRIQSLDELQKQFQDLQKEVDEMKRTVKNMDNPVKEIIRLQYQIKKFKY